MFAEILLSKSTSKTDRVYHYSIPDNLKDKIKVGHQVLVPFGFRKDIGYVVGFAEQADVKKVKDIIEITSDQAFFDEKAVELAKWMADYYCSFFIKALRMVMPPGSAAGEKRKAAAKRAFKQSQNETPLATATALPGLKPTQEQNNALKVIKSSLDDDKPDKILLYGVTGSGKTEVYMQAIAHVLEQGKSAIVLVPEISLTPQLIQRFEERFQDLTASLHSHMTIKQRSDEWRRVASGEAKIVLGARSAVFAPVKNLGLIVIDEEYETSYKQEQSPRYHAREVAFQLAKLHNAVVVLGSATPSIETFYHAEKGDYKKLTLSQRIDNRPLPPVEIIDMRKHKHSLLSEKLREELEQTLSRGEQAILFINRRGFFTFVMCRECGFTIECPHCSIALTYHTSDKRIRCNRCGYSATPSSSCPRCNSVAVTYFGIGTQRIEDEIAKSFPKARVLRYDKDSVGKRGSHEKFFTAISQGEADILIGTQMVAKGLDVGNVTLVGIVAADTALHIPEFRSTEHTFQLLTQVAGRTGRHNLPGKVIIQTFSPDHYAIKAAAEHDYKTFYQREIKERQEVGYPPFAQLVSLVISGEEGRKAMKIAEDIGNFLKKRLPNGVLGPALATIQKLRGQWRFRVLLKGQDLDQLRKAVAETLSNIVVPTDVRVIVDVAPMGML